MGQKRVLILPQHHLIESFDWSRSVEPIHLGRVLYNQPNDSALWKSVSKSLDVTIDIVLEHPNASWDWKSLGGNHAISLHDKLSNLHLPWLELAINDASIPPLSVVFSDPKASWNYDDLARKLPMRDLLRLRPVSGWLQSMSLNVSRRATISDIVSYVCLLLDVNFAR